MRNLNYSLEPGHQWERLIMVKDSRTRRTRKVKSCRATMQLQGTTTQYSIPTDIGYEGGVSLKLSYYDSLALTPGTWDFDVVANFRGYDEPVARGTIEVSALAPITSLESGTDMHIYYYTDTDYRKAFTWQDTDGTTLGVIDARMQAKDDQNNVVLDLKYFATPPNEGAIALLPGIERGYLSPLEGASLEMHISDQNSIAAGEYTFDLLAQEEGGDWGRLAEGTLTVQAVITDPDL